MLLMQLLLKWLPVRIPTIIWGREVLHLRLQFHQVDMLCLPWHLQALLQDLQGKHLGINGGIGGIVFHHLRQQNLQTIMSLHNILLPPLDGSSTSRILELIIGSTTS